MCPRNSADAATLAAAGTKAPAAPAPLSEIKAPAAQTPPAAAGTKAPTPAADPKAPAAPAAKPKFTKSQVVGRLRELKNLFEEGLLTDDFYNRKVAECEAYQ